MVQTNRKPAASFFRPNIVPSIISRERPVMRRLSLRQVEHHLVDITPAPAFRRIIALDDRMLGCMEMFCGVPVRGIVAAADMAAGAADPQVQPDAAGLQALFAAERARRHVTNTGEMGTGLCHRRPPLSLL